MSVKRVDSGNRELSIVRRPLSVLRVLIVEKIYELFVGRTEIVRNILVSALSGCP